MGPMTKKKAAQSEARETTIHIRLSPEERAELDVAAEAEHMPLGTWLRRLGLQAAAKLRRQD